jgi:hypothetical protein
MSEGWAAASVSPLPLMRMFQQHARSGVAELFGVDMATLRKVLGK